MSCQSRRTSIQNSCHPLTTIQNSYQSVLMGYSTDPRNPAKLRCYGATLNFWQTVCATTSPCRALNGAWEAMSPQPRQSFKSGSSTAFNDSAGILTARRNTRRYLRLVGMIGCFRLTNG